MKTNAINLFIVDDSLQVLTNMRNYLDEKFGRDLNIFTFLTGAHALQKMDKDTSIVILDNDLKNEDGNEILKSIKRINSKTQVIMFGSNEEVGAAVAAFRGGARDFIFKGNKTWKMIAAHVGNIITYPIRMMKREFGVPKYLAAFVVTFLSLGIVTYAVLQFMK
jgi:DNA-binding NtrC family response regulator